MSEHWPSAPTPAEIREARKRAKLNQTQAAALIYRTMRCWQEWERGRSDMDPALWEYWQIRAGLRAPEFALTG